MKKCRFFILFILMANLFSVNAQLLQNAEKAITGSSTAFSDKDASDAIKEALQNGTNKCVQLVSVVDGYFGNPAIKIPFPPEDAMIEKSLRQIGLGSKVDEAILSFNRAAEDAAAQATSIFVAAITNMSITDAISIVKGPDDAATSYLRKNTEDQLILQFQPVIKSSLDKVKATQYWNELIKRYNQIPLISKKNPDLTVYVTRRAIDGLFKMLAVQEKNIRQDPIYKHLIF